MTAFDSVLKGVRDVLLLREQVTRLTGVVEGTADRIDLMTGELGALNQRVARIEGFIEGAAASSGRTRRLPK